MRSRSWRFQSPYQFSNLIPFDFRKEKIKLNQGNYLNIYYRPGTYETNLPVRAIPIKLNKKMNIIE